MPALPTADLLCSSSSGPKETKALFPFCCGRKAGPELIPQLWPRIQEGSIARETPMALPDPGSSPAAQRDGQRDVGKKFSNEV